MFSRKTEVFLCLYVFMVIQTQQTTMKADPTIDDHDKVHSRYWYVPEVTFVIEVNEYDKFCTGSGFYHSENQSACQKTNTYVTSVLKNRNNTAGLSSNNRELFHNKVMQITVGKNGISDKKNSSDGGKVTNANQKRNSNRGYNQSSAEKQDLFTKYIDSLIDEIVKCSKRNDHTDHLTGSCANCQCNETDLLYGLARVIEATAWFTLHSTNRSNGEEIIHVNSLNQMVQNESQVSSSRCRLIYALQQMLQHVTSVKKTNYKEYYVRVTELPPKKSNADQNQIDN